MSARCQRLDDRGARCRSKAQSQHSVHDAIITDRWYLVDLCRRCETGSAPNTSPTDAPYDEAVRA